MIAFERRASTVLFNLIGGRSDMRPYLLPANACPILAMTLLKAGVAVEFVDISDDTLCMDTDAALERVRRAPGRYGGIIYVRTYGALTDVGAFFIDLRREATDALIIDDRCLCAPEFPTHPPEGVDAVLYSTGYAKYVDLQWGGYGVLADQVEYGSTRGAYDARALDRLISEYKRALAAGTRFDYRDSPWLDRDALEMEWPTYESSVRDELERIARVKCSITAIYRSEIASELQLPRQFQGWRFNILVNDVRSVLAAIDAAGLFASNHYAALSGIFSNDTAPRATRLHRQVINLFNDRHFDEHRAQQIVEVIARVARPVCDRELVDARR